MSELYGGKTSKDLSNRILTLLITGMPGWKGDNSQRSPQEVSLRSCYSDPFKSKSWKNR